jgi:hypothetical protein
MEPSGERAQERAQGERGGTSDLSSGSPVSIDHTYGKQHIHVHLHIIVQTRPAHMTIIVTIKDIMDKQQLVHTIVNDEPILQTTLKSMWMQTEEN